MWHFPKLSLLAASMFVGRNWRPFLQITVVAIVCGFSASSEAGPVVGELMADTQAFEGSSVSNVSTDVSDSFLSMGTPSCTGKSIIFADTVPRGMVWIISVDYGCMNANVGGIAPFRVVGESSFTFIFSSSIADDIIVNTIKRDVGAESTVFEPSSLVLVVTGLTLLIAICWRKELFYTVFSRYFANPNLNL